MSSAHNTQQALDRVTSYDELRSATSSAVTPRRGRKHGDGQQSPPHPVMFGDAAPTTEVGRLRHRAPPRPKPSGSSTTPGRSVQEQLLLHHAQAQDMLENCVSHLRSLETLIHASHQTNSTPSHPVSPVTPRDDAVTLTGAPSDGAMPPPALETLVNKPISRVPSTVSCASGGSPGRTESDLQRTAPSAAATRESTAVFTKGTASNRGVRFDEPAHEQQGLPRRHASNSKMRRRLPQQQQNHFGGPNDDSLDEDAAHRAFATAAKLTSRSVLRGGPPLTEAGGMTPRAGLQAQRRRTRRMTFVDGAGDAASAPLVALADTRRLSATGRSAGFFTSVGSGSVGPLGRLPPHAANEDGTMKAPYLSSAVPASVNPDRSAIDRSDTTGDRPTSDGCPDSQDTFSMSLTGSTRRRDAKQLGFLESHPIVVASDWGYISASVTLVCIAISRVAHRHTLGNASEEYPYVLGIAACQLVTLLWTALRFFVQLRVGTWEIIAHLPEIRKQYRQSWLAFDAVCAAPVDFVVLVWSSEVFFWLQLRQVVRVVRFVSMGRSGNPLKESRSSIQFFTFIVLVLFITHTATSCFQAVEAEHRSLSYVDALYWTATTVSSVGYGDVVPTHTDAWSRLFAVVIMFLGVAMVAGVTAFATSFLTSRDALEQSVREKKQMLASMLEYYSVPWEEQIEIIGLFPTALDAENEKNFTSLVSNMPGFIVERIEGYTRAKALSSSIPLFSELPTSVTIEVTSALAHRFAQANEVIVDAGDVSEEMFFLVRGVADVVVPVSASEDLVVAVLRSGSYFGEVSLVDARARSSASVIAVVLSELLVLSRGDFVALLQKHPSVADVFSKTVFKNGEIDALLAKGALSDCESIESAASGEGVGEAPFIDVTASSLLQAPANDDVRKPETDGDRDTTLGAERSTQAQVEAEGTSSGANEAARLDNGSRDQPFRTSLAAPPAVNPLAVPEGDFSTADTPPQHTASNRTAVPDDESPATIAESEDVLTSHARTTQVSSLPIVLPPTAPVAVDG